MANIQDKDRKFFTKLYLGDALLNLGSAEAELRVWLRQNGGDVYLANDLRSLKEDYERLHARIMRVLG